MEPVPPSKSKLSRRRPNPERKPRQSASEAKDKENPSHPYDVIVISEAGSSGAAIEDPVYGRHFSAAADIKSRNVLEETNKKLAPIFTRKRDSRSEGTQRNSYKHKQHPKSSVIITKSNVSLFTKSSEDWELKAIESSSVSQCSTSTKRKKFTTSSGWREELSAPVRESCLEEIQESNPTFPVRQIFAALRKKDERRVQLLESPGKIGRL